VEPGLVQRAFIRGQGAQCGYCLNGMIITTQALLSQCPAPDRATITQALRHNLCRCGTHVEIVASVELAARPCRRRDPVSASDHLPSGLPSLNDLLALPDTLIVVARESDGRELPYVMVDGRGWIHGFNGHVDLGTGIRTALAQIVAEELDADPSRVRMVLGDTGRTPNQGATIASDTIQTTAVPCVPPPRRPRRAARAGCGPARRPGRGAGDKKRRGRPRRAGDRL
jgi:hypothetical protein